MADQYGLNDISALSGPNQTTARQVQQAFDNSNAARLRMQARYSLPELSNFNEDSALARAQTSAGLINQNQQLQNVIDASHHTPHGVAENLSAYLPLLGGANQLAATLFGYGGANSLSQNGLVGLAGKGWNSLTHPGSGTSYTVNPDGTISLPNSGMFAPTLQGDEGGWPGDLGGTFPDWGGGTNIDFGTDGWTSGFDL